MTPLWLHGPTSERLHLAHHSRIGALGGVGHWKTWCDAQISGRAATTREPSEGHTLCGECLSAFDAFAAAVTGVVAARRYVRTQREARVFAGIPAGERVLGGAS